MKTTEANIEIIRSNGLLQSVSIVMPTWNRVSDAGHVNIDVPFLGMKTVARDESDADEAVKELIQCFCISSEKFGQGLEKELMTLGWIYAGKVKENPLLTFEIGSDDFIFEQIVSTGEPYVYNNLSFA